MEIIYGSKSYPDYILDDWEETLSKHLAGSIKLESVFTYFVEPLGSELSEPSQSILAELFESKNCSEIAQTKKPSFVIVPRFGTTSPWASKAQDIIERCGIDDVLRVERGVSFYTDVDLRDNQELIIDILSDRMTQEVIWNLDLLDHIFYTDKPKPLHTIDILNDGIDSIYAIDKQLGLALSDDEVRYLYEQYCTLDRNPTDAELMMFSVANSEHCRHKVFNASWQIDGQPAKKSLFEMIQHTYKNYSENIKSAYKDNGAILAGFRGEIFHSDSTNTYDFFEDILNLVIKVETHNHPTAISPIPGAATGSGGEIRDEGATGRGAIPKAGICGFAVSHLNIESNPLPWEFDYGKPERIVSALNVMLEAPIGAASFNNEFGRPNLGGYFRTLQFEETGKVWGYHKPIMIAGGLGTVTEPNIQKLALKSGNKLIVLGGPGMRIGLGGGSASSVASGDQSKDLDFASVQRQNPEMQRRAQEVINSCWRKGKDNPIISIHDVGAGGLSNALPEIVNDSNMGAKIDLRMIPSVDFGMSPMEIWSNEAQERYVLVVDENNMREFQDICEREQCPFSQVGVVDDQTNLYVHDPEFDNDPVDIPSEVVFGNPPKMLRTYNTQSVKVDNFQFDNIEISQAVDRVLRHPSVGSKSFLINIGDRTVGGLVAQDQMVGRWQIPIADCAVTHNSFKGYQGEAMAMGERPGVALVDHIISARLAVGEAVTNLLSSDIKRLEDIKLSANWMVAADAPGQNQALYETVEDLGMSFCSDLKLTIPVGKDSTSMQTHWTQDGVKKDVTSPLTLNITGFSLVEDVRKTLTPELADVESKLVYIPVTKQTQDSLGGSILAEVFTKSPSKVPGVNAGDLKYFFNEITALKEQDKILAYHDCSDGGLFVSVVEMLFASRFGVELNYDLNNNDLIDHLFSEQLGAVIQISTENLEEVLDRFDAAIVLGSPSSEEPLLKMVNKSEIIYEDSIFNLQQIWAKNSYEIQKLRDNPACVEQEYTIDQEDPGLNPVISFEIKSSEKSDLTARPKVAILREQGVNGYLELAAAFNLAGFESVDVHMSDLRSGRHDLSAYAGLAVGGGFSYGDVLGAGSGWAKSILFNPMLLEQFKEFFLRPDTFSIGICNGCQMLSQLKSIIPGANHWPKFVKNISQQFEARLVTVEISETPSIFFKGMEGSRLLVPVAHGEGQVFREADQEFAEGSFMNYVDNYGKPTNAYPFNPNGSLNGATGFTSEDGRSTILMPHPERSFRTSQLSWHPEDWGDDSPWMQMFYNAYNWVKS